MVGKGWAGNRVGAGRWASGGEDAGALLVDVVLRRRVLGRHRGQEAWTEQER